MSTSSSGDDDLPYEALAFYHTHPRLLRMVSALNGLAAPAAEECRVLELGCGSGSNLIPMTQSLPGASFVGVDIASAQVARGREFVKEAGIQNLDLRAASILDIDDGWGKFDYVICHGVYSWVPPEVQKKILSVCKNNLTPGGVAYVSYNTLPGWRVRGIVRDLLLYRVRETESLADKVELAQETLDRWHGEFDEKGDLLTRLIRQEIGSLLNEPPGYLAYEYLTPHNEPLYFHQFMERTSSSGLQYLGEARVETMVGYQPAQSRAKIEGLARRTLDQEQYLDFLMHRHFRQTLLCHGDVNLDPRPSLARLQDAWAAKIAEPIIPLVDYCSQAPVRFQLPDRSQRIFRDPLLKTLLVCLKQAGPTGLQIGALWNHVRDRLAHPPDRKLANLHRDPLLFLQQLLDAFREGYVALTPFPPGPGTAPGERPLAPAVFRRQAANGQDLTSLHHRPVELHPLDRFLLEQLDGTRDRAALIELLADLCTRQPEWFVEEGQEQPPDRERLAEVLEARLLHLANEAVLQEGGS